MIEYAVVGIEEQYSTAYAIARKKQYNDNETDQEEQTEMEIGAQFYTVRDLCRTTEGLAETLKKVADIGYKTVQLSGTCPYDAEWMKQQLAANGLRCVLTHIPMPRLTGETGQVIRDHEVIGCDHIGLGYYSFDEEKGDSFDRFVSAVHPVARAFREAGKLFMYHNHDQEFKKLNGRLILEQLAEVFPADQMGFTLDTYWVQKGGGDPAQWLERLSGRIPVIHLKDYAYGAKMSVIGEGNINFDRVFEKAEAGGTRFMMVEQDDCNGEDPLECLRRSYAYLRSRGFD